MTDKNHLHDILSQLRAQDGDLYHLVLLCPAESRAALATLFLWDGACATAAAASPEVMVNLIRLAWWREQVEQLDQAQPTTALPAPLLNYLRDIILPAGITPAALAALEAPWAQLLEGDAPSSISELAHWCCQRGGALFDLATTLLAPEADTAQRQSLHQHGHIWALAQYLRHHSLSGALPDAPACVPLPPALRPLAALGQLAYRDCLRATAQPAKAPQSKSSPARLLRLLFSSLRRR